MPIPPMLTEETLSDSRKLRNFTREVLRTLGIKPSKRRGQNFTISPRYVSSFMESLGSLYNKLSEPWALEIGTGLGVISLAGIHALPGFKVISVELDRLLFEASSYTVGWIRELSLVNGDGLEISASCDVPLVFSSTPFNISTALTLALARNNRVTHAVLGVQKEVADRLIAKPGSPDYGRLSVLSQLIFKIRKVSTHPPREFWPSPEVSASIITLERVNYYDPIVHGALERLTACVFSQRNRIAKKVVANCMSKLGGEGCSKETGDLPEGMRVRELSPEILEELSKRLVRCSS